ncbi:pantoate--beta-alanine ligase [Anoxybacterium hadale]|uniref:Pantoate--beta-alanine ligase n=1 Tax=Anoxybacterium hadale TaxID=3408580 RepID=A0ACD1AB32_9FIRM|nr:pantoate--beta-alanine ligase [Clostridiales bacterium]
MKIVKTIQEVREQVRTWRTEGLTVGFVPTMGYLHEGHQSLILRADGENDRVVVSIFINPLQFGEKEDIESYPVDLERDREICASAGADLIFHPDSQEMYGRDFCSFVDMDGLTETLCGKSRPGHFRGVCTVVMKLFNIVKPDRAYFGQKDAQQIAVIQRMVRDLNLDLQIVPCETVREADGLAKSSRNVRLNPEERKASNILHEALLLAEKSLDAGVRASDEIERAIRDTIQGEKLARLDYAEIVDLQTLKPVEVIRAPALVAAAVYIGNTRLIDNFIYRN